MVTGGLGCGRGGVVMRVVLLLLLLVLVLVLVLGWRLGAADRVGERAWVGGGNAVVSRGAVGRWGDWLWVGGGHQVVSRVPRSTSGYRPASRRDVRFCWGRYRWCRFANHRLQAGTPGGVLCYSAGNRGFREWIAEPPVIGRSSLRDGVC